MIGKMLGGTIKAVWWLLQAAWGHPVLRLVILSAGTFWFLPRVWWPSAVPPGSHTYTLAGIVVAAAEVWWMWIGDTVHHLYPRPWMSGVLRMGYPILAFPLVSAWSRHEWLAAVTVAVAAGLVGIVPYFTNSRRTIR